jgi:hypothetical protein
VFLSQPFSSVKSVIFEPSFSVNYVYQTLSVVSQIALAAIETFVYRITAYSLYPLSYFTVIESAALSCKTLSRKAAVILNKNYSLLFEKKVIPVDPQVIQSGQEYLRLADEKSTWIAIEGSQHQVTVERLEEMKSLLSSVHEADLDKKFELHERLGRLICPDLYRQYEGFVAKKNRRTVQVYGDISKQILSFLDNRIAYEKRMEELFVIIQRQWSDFTGDTQFLVQKLGPK